MTNPTHEPTEDELIDAALAAMNQAPLPTNTPLDAGDELIEPEPAFNQPFTPPAASPTLQALEENRRPRLSTVCEECPNSVWFSSPLELKCYCRVMFLVTWSSKDPNQITHCDGLYLGQEG